MAGGKLTVEIGADITDLRKGITDAEKELGRLRVLKNKEIRLGIDTSGTSSKISELEKKLVSLNKVSESTQKATQAIGSAASSAAPALAKLGGASNGATEGIAELSGAMGSGGLTVAITAVIAGLKFAYEAFEKNRIAAGAMAKAVSDANAEALKSSGEEISTIKALVAVAQDRNKTDEERLKAVKYLKQEWPETYKNMKDEQILLGQTAEATKILTDNLLKKAKAQVFASKIGENEANIEILKAEGRELFKNNDLITKAAKLLGKRSPTLDAISDSIDTLTKQNEALRTELEKNVTFGFEQDKIKDTPKIFNTPQVSKIGQTIIPAPVFDTLGVAVFNGQIDEFGNKIKSLPNVMQTTLPKIANTISVETAKMLLALQDFNDRASAIISGALADTFAGIGSAIGDALANGTDIFGAIGATLLDSLGSLLVQMGKMAIQVGVGLLAIKVALKSLNPAVAIGAGVALVALGSFFSSKSKALSGQIGGGGGASGSSGSGANNQSFSSSSFSSRGDGGGTVVFEIAGQKLIGVLSNTLNANRRLGGSLGL